MLTTPRIHLAHQNDIYQPGAREGWMEWSVKVERRGDGGLTSTTSVPQQQHQNHNNHTQSHSKHTIPLDALEEREKRGRSQLASQPVSQSVKGSRGGGMRGTWDVGVWVWDMVGDGGSEWQRRYSEPDQQPVICPNYLALN